MANNANISGEGNITLQSIFLDNNSQINIHTIDRKALINDLEQHFNTNKQIFQLFIITTTQQSLSNLTHIPDEILFRFYGQTPKDWKPYGEENITDLITNYAKITTLDAEVRAFVIDSQALLADKKTSAYLKLNRGQMVVIVDGLALAFEENRKVAKIFDDVAIGGCLIPIYPKFQENIAQQIETLINQTFEDWQIYLNDFAERGFLQAELELKSKKELFKSMTVIGRNHLGIAVKNKKFSNANGLNQM